ncbi:MAG: 2-hydroxychromene-2-carboxylate isomerase [Pseudomonadota bacterium]
MKTIEFWFEFASTYSYLSAMRIDDLAAEHGVSVVWKPFLLGPIFKSFGWETSPFNVYPQKGTYMWRDLERRAARLGLPFQRPDPGTGAFPQNGLTAARVAMIGLQSGWGRDFCRRIYRAQFVEGRDISDRALVLQTATDCGVGEDALTDAASEPNKTALRQQTEQAASLGIFGAPSFIVGEELFWGDDRLEDALHWAGQG